ncbi:PIG-L deacetylase family protein [Actinomycetospora termitidis]|uniref:PIG-L deacetylase family protein n=1 Tax=Actinomycetospora termitidis TaxID=3053470 RepID=A0ABT7MJ05_9PSEU|nr:PIG-L deacetylase family protein [Actinomycetospora sp. Odt1-22]MDL5159957.1 PIG-L deacetylase family protein [Actinomycetospora sp. Odt1-22]
MESFPDDWSHALAVAAHPDDLEYGVSAAVAAWTAAGRTVTYLLVTRGEAGIATMPPAEAGPAREVEERASAAEVGVQDVRFLDHPDGTVEESVALRRDIARVIRDVRPDLVVTLNHEERWDGGGWNSADHRAVGRAAIDAVADAGTRWIFPDDGEAHQVRHVAVAATPGATHEVDVTGFVDAAVASLARHRLYLEALSEVPVEEQAREVVHHMVGDPAAPRVRFELLG